MDHASALVVGFQQQHPLAGLGQQRSGG